MRGGAFTIDKAGLPLSNLHCQDLAAIAIGLGVREMNWLFARERKQPIPLSFTSTKARFREMCTVLASPAQEYASLVAHCFRPGGPFIVRQAIDTHLYPAVTPEICTPIVDGLKEGQSWEQVNRLSKSGSKGNATLMQDLLGVVDLTPAGFVTFCCLSGLYAPESA